MPAPGNTPDLTPNSDRRRIVVVLIAAVSFPLVLMAVTSLIGPGRHPWVVSVVPVLIVVVLLAVRIAATVHGRRTRETTDERAVELHRRATSVAWQVTLVALMATVGWMWARHGIRASEPYLYLAVLSGASYVATVMWRRWRGF